MRVECQKCGRPTYAGCGAHVEQVLANVPPIERCHCREKERKDVSTSPRSGRSEGHFGRKA
jgi:hypothetical protein